MTNSSIATRTIAVAFSLGALAAAQGSAGFERTDYSTAPGLRPTKIIRADVDGDGLDDLITPNVSSDDFAVLINLGDGVLSSVRTFATGSLPSGAAASDLDGDGDLDVVISRAALPGGVDVFENDGTGNFTSVASLPAGSRPNDVVCCDLDGQMGPDIVVCNFAGGLSTGNISILYNTGGLTFSAPTILPAGERPQTLCSGDLDGVNGPDVAVAYQSGSVGVFLNDGAGSLLPWTTYPASSARTIVCCDLDADSRIDLLVGDSGADAFVLWNDGTATFSTRTSFPLGTQNPIAVDTGDFDDDGLPDVVIASNLTSFGQGGGLVSIIPNLGSRTFGNPQTTANGSDTRSVTYFEGLLATANTNVSTITVIRHLPGLTVRDVESAGTITYDFEVADPLGDGGTAIVIVSFGVSNPFSIPGVDGTIRVDPASPSFALGFAPLAAGGSVSIPLATLPDSAAFAVVAQAGLLSPTGGLRMTNAIAMGQGDVFPMPGIRVTGRGTLDLMTGAYRAVLTGPSTIISLFTGPGCATLLDQVTTDLFAPTTVRGRLEPDNGNALLFKTLSLPFLVLLR